jgi:hypothetical protein
VRTSFSETCIKAIVVMVELVEVAMVLQLVVYVEKMTLITMLRTMVDMNSLGSDG